MGVAPLVFNCGMRPSVALAEMGLALVFMARSFTRIYCLRGIARLGPEGARAASVPGGGLIPPWVSLFLLGGWATTAVATASLIVG